MFVLLGIPRKLKTNKSAGIDKIRSETIEEIKTKISSHIKHINNKILETEIFPNLSKYGKL